MKLFVVLVAASTLGYAPQSFDMSSLMYRPSLMLARQDVKKELRLTKDQSKQVDAIQRELQKSSQGVGNDLNKGLASLNAMGEADVKLVALLEEPQKLRLKEIIIQAKGVNALRDEDVFKELGLNEEQLRKLEEAHRVATDSYLEKARARFDKKGMEAISKKYEETAMGLLTPEQAAKFKAMQGKPFKNARPPGMPPF